MMTRLSKPQRLRTCTIPALVCALLRIGAGLGVVALLQTPPPQTRSLAGINSLVGWDEMVMMPEGSAKSRAMQKKVLAGIVHERCTDPKIGEQLKELEASEGSLGEAEAAVVREAKRECAPLCDDHACSPPSRGGLTMCCAAATARRRS